MNDQTISTGFLATATPQPTAFQPYYPPPVPLTQNLSQVFTPPPATPVDNQINDIIQQTQNLRSQATAESAFRTTQENQQNIPQLTQTQQDLNTQLQQLNLNQQGIPIQTASQYLGRAGVVQQQGINEEALRQNAIKSLSVASQLAATQGNLTTAMALVDRAVRAQFDPIKQQIQNNIDNLDMILKSPTYTAEQQQRAQVAQNQQYILQQNIQHQENNFKTAQTMAAAAVKNYPNDQKALLSAQQVNALNPSDPTYLQQAYALVGQYQSNPQEVQTALLDQQYKQAQIANIQADTNLTNTQRQQLISKVNATPAPLLSPQTAQPTEYQTQKSQETLATVKLLRNKVNNLTVGFFARPLSFIPGTQAYDFAANLQTLKSNIAFNELNQMRSDSKTGGALGQISDKEEQMLSSVLGALDQFQSQGSFLANLQRIEDSITTWQNAHNNLGSTGSTATTTKRGKPFDMQAAKAAGYSDQEIQDFINNN